MVAIAIRGFGGGGNWHGWGNHHPVGALGRLTGGHFHGFGDDFGGHLGHGSFQINNLSSFGHDGPHFGYNTWGFANGWGHHGWGQGWGGHSNIHINLNRGWDRDDHYHHHDHHRHHHHHHHDREFAWGNAFDRAGHGLRGFGAGTAYGLDRCGDRFAGGDLLGGLGEMLLAPIRGMKGMFQGCEMRDAGYAEAPQCHGGGPRTRFLG